ncbi:hypothetical protein DQ04_01441020 [Trypanosoma grayi]|uniref:hypothetical protein n=1 Tax=Trypanosoma grayi TaxID=71804 RepID=UPI0004F49B14|nr:hypothetical protein DQ04_01441020 [Trypanosoma grayi]KEG12756.1 hypothetical protein DQ04_01441020 [Trypanosoma grayi]
MLCNSSSFTVFLNMQHHHMLAASYHDHNLSTSPKRFFTLNSNFCFRPSSTNALRHSHPSKETLVLEWCQPCRNHTQPFTVHMEGLQRDFGRRKSKLSHCCSTGS